MKRAVILHAMGQTSKGHWYPWLKQQLETYGYEVWLPDLPTSDRPDAKVMTEFLLANKSWKWTDNLVIGHSSGAVEILHLLPKLPQHIKAAILVGSFDHVLWEKEHELLFNQPIDFAKAKTQADEFIFIHGDDDPWCPVEGAHNLATKTNGELIIVHQGGHFSTSLDPRFTEFPQLIDILDSRELL